MAAGKGFKSKGPQRINGLSCALLGRTIYGATSGDTNSRHAGVRRCPWTAQIRTNDQGELSFLARRCCSFAREIPLLDAKAGTLLRGPGHAFQVVSGKILWGLGIVSALEGPNTPQAGGSIGPCGLISLPRVAWQRIQPWVFLFFQTGQIAKAKAEVMNRFKKQQAEGSGALDIDPD